MKKVTFQELYRKALEAPTPRQQFLNEIAAVTEKSPLTVQNWANGIQTPDRLSRKAIAEHFGCDPDHLFPQPEANKAV